MKNIRTISYILIIVILVFSTVQIFAKIENTKNTVARTSKDILYTGPVYNIFFHSLLVYPKLAFRGDTRSNLFKTYMITKKEFDNILPELYKNNFVLVNIHELYTVDKNGTVHRKEIYLPANKKPLVISIDDLNYYKNQEGRGMAQKIILNKNNSIQTEIIDPKGQLLDTTDGDIIPIVDDFVSKHSDFSIHGAKGIIAVTGYDGVFGYRTESSASTSPTYKSDRKKIFDIANVLKSTGWVFASHSYTHESSFVTNKITLENLKVDTELWDNEVRPLVGDTDIFIGPFGQVFKDKDPRRNYLISKGFHVFYGVGASLYTNYFSNYIAIDRAPIDGMRLEKKSKILFKYFDVEKVIDPIR
ncbi:hypothetical protein H7Y21_00550 [Arenimonas sp.]|nr:hypothetical protein [Candidatus Parcubacteria bacterium]